MRMDSEMIGILLSDSMHYTIVVSLEMSDEPPKKRTNDRFGFIPCFLIISKNKQPA